MQRLLRTRPYFFCTIHMETNCEPTSCGLATAAAAGGNNAAVAAGRAVLQEIRQHQLQQRAADTGRLVLCCAACHMSSCGSENSYVNTQCLLLPVLNRHGRPCNAVRPELVTLHLLGCLLLQVPTGQPAGVTRSLPAANRRHSRHRSLCGPRYRNLPSCQNARSYVCGGDQGGSEGSQGAAEHRWPGR
jgi:hypothetical protein